MKHLIIYSNPDKNSFSHEIKEYVEKFSLDLGHEIEVRDLYLEEFNPVLSLEELEMESDEKVLPDVKKEQDYIDWADTITFIYPIWWQIPAMMKGYFDRVFSYGYAYRLEGDQPTGLLPSKKVLKYNSMGTPREIYEKNGLRQAYEKAIDKGILESSGLKVIESILFGGNPRDHDELRDQYLKELETSLKRAFPQ
nr:NAD(P)H-dependent oxidoreductase [Tissierella sp.]